MTTDERERPEPTGADGAFAAPSAKRRLAELALLGAAAAWGLTFVLIQDAVETFPPVAFVAYRFLVAGLLLALPQWRGLRRLPPAGWRAGAGLGAVLAVGYLSQTVGLRYTSAASAGFITGLYVVFTPLLAWAVLREQLSRWGWACVGAATVGLFLLSGGTTSWSPLGDGLMLVCALAFAVQIVATDWAVARIPPGPLVAVELLACGAAALVVATATGQLAVPEGRPVWTGLLFTTVVAGAAAYLVQAHAQRWTSAARTSLLLATEPVLAGVFGVVIGGDRLTVVSWVGAGLMTAGVLAMEADPTGT